MNDQSPLDLSAATPGTTALCLASNLAAGRDALRSSLADASEDAAALIVTTDDARAAVEALRARSVDPGSVGVVDASGTERAVDGVGEAAAVPGPGSLSALGIAISDLLDRLGHRFDRVRIGFHSTTDVLRNAALPASFRFFHVLLGRVRTAGAVLVGTMDANAHAEETRRTIAELFDRTARQDERDDGSN